jgi:hypothetical protein
MAPGAGNGISGDAARAGHSPFLKPIASRTQFECNDALRSKVLT